MWGGGVEHRGQRLHVDDLAVREAEAAGLVHPGVDRDDEERRREPADHDGDAGQQVLPGRKAVPAVEVDADEDGLEEEGDALDRERQPDDVSEPAHELRPEDAHLEREDRPQHGTDGKEDGRRLGPLPRQSHVGGVARAVPAPLGQQRQARQADADTGQDDVAGERERHLGAGCDEIRGAYRAGEQQVHERDSLSSTNDSTMQCSTTPDRLYA